MKIHLIFVATKNNREIKIKDLTTKKMITFQNIFAGLLYLSQNECEIEKIFYI